MTFPLLLVILTMADLCWSQCRTAAWWRGFDQRGSVRCSYSTEYVTGFYRNSNKGSNDKIGLLEEARCCRASVPNQNEASTCVSANWWRTLDSNNRWAVCPNGYFIQGLYRNDGDWLRHIELGRCCKPNNLPRSYLHCYEKDVGESFNSRGWSTCAWDSSYHMAGFFKGGCDKLHCIDTFKCCSMHDGCQMANWATAFNKEGWVHCDSSTHYVTGLFRNNNRGSNDKIFLLEEAKCCPAPAPDQNKASVCQNEDWINTLDGTNVWAKCPTGYFIRGFRRSSGEWLNNIEEAQCCKPNGFPNRYEACYDESISFDKKGLSKCTKSDYYVTGIYKGNCRQLYCIESLKCCKMNIDECSVSNPCKNGAVCSDTAGSYKCTCQSGYEGINCDNDIDECADSPCKNGAPCVNLQGSYRCDCYSGYTGSNCETDSEDDGECIS